MKLPAGTIWDVRVQSVCAAITSLDGDRVEVWMCANFGQVTLDPPRLIINPNRAYPIEGAILRERRFAVNILDVSQLDVALKLVGARRREPAKADALGLNVQSDPVHHIPWMPGCLRTVFCELEQVLDTGDHTVMIARVLESREAAEPRRPALLYPSVTAALGGFPRASAAVRKVLAVTGLDERLRALLARRRGATAEPDLQASTFREGGLTDGEIEGMRQFGLTDTGRILQPPDPLPRPLAPAFLSRRVAVCVAGVGSFGSFHCRLFRKADPNVELYVCGRDEERTARVARGVGAAGYVVGLERAAQDPRFEAMSLALPHHLHPEAAELAAAGGKHILVEKPIANSLEAADRMIAAARRAGVILMVAENMHFRPDVADAARAIARGDIGEPLYWTAHAGGRFRPEGWKASAETMGGGVLLDLGIHYVRTLRLLMGEPDRVLGTRAMQIHTKMEGEDSAQVLFSSAFGWQGHLLASWSTPRGDAPDIVVAGERGVFHLWGNRKFYDFFPAAPRPLTQLVGMLRPAWLAEKLMRPGLQLVRRRFEGAVPANDYAGYSGEIREFLSAIDQNRQPVSGGPDGRRDLQVTLCAAESLLSDTWTRVPPP